MTLEIEAMTVRAGGSLILDAVSLVAGAGRLTGLIGPNGAGKSTLMRTALGLQPAEAGKVAFAGTDFLALPRRQRARLSAFVEQEIGTDARLTGRDVVMLGRIPFQSDWQAGPSAEDERVADEAIAAMAMGAFSTRLYQTLSGGEQQRLQIARALAQQPQLLVLDEPTSHLDVHAQLSILQLLRHKANAGMTVLLALHDLNLAAGFCDELVVLHGGRCVAHGTPEAVLTPALLRTVYQVEATLMRHPRTGGPMIAYDL